MQSSTSTWLTRLEAKFCREVDASESRLVEQWLLTATTGIEQKGERYFRRAQALFQADQVTGQVLDAGCGDGQIALRFALGGAKVTGVDIDCEFIEIAQLHAQEFPNIKAQFQCIDLCDSTVLTDVVFDLILSIDVIEHVLDPVGYLTGLRRRLKPGGKIWLSTPHRFAPSNILADPHYELAGLTLLPNTCAAWYAVNCRRKTRVYDVTRLYTPRSLAKLAESSGLVISFQTTQVWNEALEKRFWLKQLSELPLVDRILFSLYHYRLRTVEAILSVPPSL